MVNVAAAASFPLSPIFCASFSLCFACVTFVDQVICFTTKPPAVCFYFCKRVRLTYVLNSDLT